MPINNPQAVKFCNEKVRTLADLIEKTRRTAEQFAIDIVADFEAKTVDKDNSQVVSDGADTDGRRVITKGDVRGLKYVAEQLVTALTLDDRRTLVAKVSVNGSPIY